MQQLRHQRRQYREHGEEIREKNRNAWPKQRKRELERLRARYRKNADAEKRKAKERYRQNRTARIAQVRERQRVLRLIAPEVLREYQRTADRRAPHKRTARAARRRAAGVDATPWWADRAAMDEIYALAELMTRLLGQPYEVDHIVPLQGKTVCGLHVPANLQVISAAENNAKSNKKWPGKPQ